MIGGIIHVLQSGCRWRDAPAVSMDPIRRCTTGSFAGHAKGCGNGCSGRLPKRQAHLRRCFSTAPTSRRIAAGAADRFVAPDLIGDMALASCLADAAYDSNNLRRSLLARGTRPVIPNNPTRKRLHPFDRRLYKRRNLIERTICRLKDWRRIATRDDKLATHFLAAVTTAAIIFRL